MGKVPTVFHVQIIAVFLFMVGALAPAQTLPRNFTLPSPLYSSNSAWRQSASSAAVLPQSEQQILAWYRVLLGENSSLYPPGSGFDYAPWPFMDINYDDFSIPISRMGTGQQTVVVRDYDGNPSATNPKLPMTAGAVTVPAPDGIVRPAGPTDTGADGHLVLYNPQSRLEYDFWQATTERDGLGNSLGGGRTGTTIFEAGMIDYFQASGSGTNPQGYYSARATGVPLLAGLLLPEDIESGAINHALAFATIFPRNRNTANPENPYPSDYFYPVSTTETDFFSNDPLALAAGQRIRLKQTIVDANGNSIDENSLAPVTRMFLAAMRNYGAYLVDASQGFSFYAEDIHTAPLNLTDDQVNALIGQSPGTPIPPAKTKWQLVIETLNEELGDTPGIPIASGAYWEYTSGGQDPATATFGVSNFEVIESAAQPTCCYTGWALYDKKER